MIKSVFSVNVLIKDHDMPSEFTADLSSAVKAIFQSLMVERGLSRDDVGNEEFPVFTDENLKVFPVLKQLQSLIIDGFYELAVSFEGNTLTKEMIEKMMCARVGKLPLMKKGDYKGLHLHKNSIAFAVFYLTDVDNQQHGGKLILRDPSFHSNFNFHQPDSLEIETKKNRLIVAPGYVWHEVTPYNGDEDRVTVAINLHPDNLNV